MRRVGVARSADGFLVTIDGRTLHVNPARIDAHVVSLIVGHASHEVAMVPEAGGALAVRVDSSYTSASVDSGRRWGRTDDHGAAGPQRITAPMPGKVVRVLVAKGDRVHARQPLVVVEAMKMENELRAPRDGTVADVAAREGLSVDAGALLVVVQ